MSKRLQSEFDQQIAEAAKLPVFAKRDGDEAWNKDVDARLGQAKEIMFGRLTEADMARAALWAAASPALLQSLAASDAKVKALTAELEGIKKSTIRPGEGESASSGSEGEGKGSKGLSLVDSITEQAVAAGLKMGRY